MSSRAPDSRKRRSIRLQGYDYSQTGSYFITICTQGRGCLFGEIVDGEMLLNSAGRMVQAVWNEIPAHYSGVDTDSFIVMPNHIHGVITIVGAGPCACPGAAPNQKGGQPQGVAPTRLSLPDVTHRFKTMTTKQYVDGVKQAGWLPFPGKLWQRNYYEHIIRDEDELDSIREYIIANPAQWNIDRENPRALNVTGTERVEMVP